MSVSAKYHQRLRGRRASPEEAMVSVTLRRAAARQARAGAEGSGMGRPGGRMGRMAVWGGEG